MKLKKNQFEKIIQVKKIIIKKMRLNMVVEKNSREIKL